MNDARICIQGGVPLCGAAELPADAAVAQVALVLHALAEGKSSIVGDTRGARSKTTIAALRALGVVIEHDDHRVHIDGRGLASLTMSSTEIDCGRSQTTLALLAGMLCGQRFGTRLVLDPLAVEQPLDDLVGALRARGAQIGASGRQGASLRAPVSIAPLLEDEHLAGIECVLPQPDTDAKAAVLLSGLFSAAPTSVAEPLLSPDHVERMLSALGVPVRRIGSMAGFDPAQWDRTLHAGEGVTLPSDTTLAAFVCAAASAVDDSHVALGAVGMNPTRSGFFDALRLLGARSLVVAKGERAGNEPVAEVQVQGGNTRGGPIGGEVALRCGDSLPALCLLGARAMRGLSLHDGEAFAPAGAPIWSDLASLVSAFGARCSVQGAGLAIARAAHLRAAHIDAREDHRLALAAVIFGLAAEGDTVVDNAAHLVREYPGLFDTLRSLGARLYTVDTPATVDPGGARGRS